MPPTYEMLLDVYRQHSVVLQAYQNLLMNWSPSLNLVSRGTLSDFKQRHILDSMQLFFYLPPQNTHPVIVDLGSGAGLPGLILSILGYDNIVLIDSDRKKTLFLKTAIRTLNLTAQVICSRIEEIEHLQADWIISRAFAPLDRCVSSSSHLVKKDSTYLIHKGAGIKKELEAFQKAWYARYEFFNSLTSPDSVILKMEHVSKR